MAYKILGAVDLPADVPPNRVRITGWLYCKDENFKPETVLVRVGHKFYIAEFPITRSDVAEVLKDVNAEKSGWQVEVDFEPDIEQRLAVSSFVITQENEFHPVANTTTFVSPGHSHSDSTSVFLADNQLVEGDIDRIELVPEHQMVRALGWVISRGSPVVGVLAQHSGKWSFARCDQQRADVSERYFGQVQPGSHGWCIEDNSLWGEIDVNEIRFYALLEDRSIHLFAIEAWHPYSDQLVISRIVHKQSKSYLVKVEGWLFSDGDIDYIEVLNDDEVLGKARINQIDLWKKSDSNTQISRTISVYEYTYCTDALEKKHANYVARARYSSGKHLLSSAFNVTHGDEFMSSVTHRSKNSPGIRPKRALRTGASSRPTTRIGVVTHRLDLGGAQLYMRDLINELRKDAEIEFFVVAEGGGPLEEVLRGWGIQVNVTKQLLPNSAEHILSHVKSVKECLESFEPDVILANTLHCGYASEIAQHFNCPSVLFVHESFTFDHYLVEAYGPGQVSKDAETYLRESFEAFDAVVFEAEATLELLRADLDEKRQHLIRYGIPVSDYPPLRRVASTDTTTFLSIATFSPRKNQLGLVQAFARSMRRHSDVQLRLIGSGDDTYSEAVVNLVRHLDISKQVSIEPVTPDIHEALISADVFVSASDIESMPRSMMEAMLAGCPVLASAAPGVSELVSDELTGWLVGVRDISDLEHGFKRVLARSTLEIRQMGDRARDYIQDHHDTPQFGTRIRELIDNLLQ